MTEAQLDPAAPSQVDARAPRLKTFFLHVPKTAGHSIAAAIGWAYPEDRRLLAIGRGFGPGTVAKADVLERPYAEVREHADFIYGHLLHADIDAWAGDELHRDYAVVTVVREPLERAISAYTYLSDRGADVRDLSAWVPLSDGDDPPSVDDALAGCDDVNDFLRTRPMANGAFISQCAAIGGSDDFGRARAALTERFLGFPTVESLEPFWIAYHARLGGPYAPVGVVNVSATDVAFERLDPDAVAAFYRDCIDDVRLYAWAKRSWRRHLDQALRERLDGPAAVDRG